MVFFFILSQRMKKNTCIVWNSSVTPYYKEEEKKKNKEEENSSKQTSKMSVKAGSFFSASSGVMSLTEGLEHKLFYQIAKIPHQTSKKYPTKEEQKLAKIAKRIATTIALLKVPAIEDKTIRMYCPNPKCRVMQYFENTHVCKYCNGSQIMGEQSQFVEEDTDGFMEGVKTSERRFDLEMFPEQGFTGDDLSSMPSQYRSIEFKVGKQVPLRIINPLDEQLIDGGYTMLGKRWRTIDQLMKPVEWDIKASKELQQKKMSIMSILAHNKAINAQGGKLIWKDKKSNKYTDTNGNGNQLVKTKDVFYNDTDFKKLGYFRAGVDLAMPESEYELTVVELQQLGSQDDCMDCKQMDYYKMNCPENCTFPHQHNYQGGVKWEVSGHISSEFLEERARAKHNVETKEERGRKGTITEAQKEWLPRFITKHGLNKDDFDVETLSQSQASKIMWGLNVVSRKKINDKNNEKFDETLVETTIKELIKLCGTVKPTI